ncbi:MAG: fucose isomerase, partial [SAR324 cluster bacterium]|nr:fucose isomerase [SAR324 cluster bacterium]
MNHVEPLKISVLPLARPTFDVPFAEETCRNAWNLLEQIPAEWSGSKELLFDAGAVEGRLEEMVKNPPDLLLVLQLTFTDATMTVKLAETLDAPMVFWSFPEERTGGRLRLNSLCGINLASHALGKSGMRCDYLHIDPQDERAGSEIQARINAHQARKNLSKTRLAVLGQHPDGFHTCAYDAQELKKRTGVTVDQLELKDLFDEAKQVPENKVEELRQELKPRIQGL